MFTRCTHLDANYIYCQFRNDFFYLCNTGTFDISLNKVINNGGQVYSLVLLSSVHMHMYEQVSAQIKGSEILSQWAQKNNKSYHISFFLYGEASKEQHKAFFK